MSYPTEMELAQRLVTAGLREEISADLGEEAEIIEIVKEEWETRTGWKPYLQEATPSDLPWRTARRVVSLDSSIMELGSVEIGGVTLVEGTDYRFIGQKAPFRGIELTVPPRGPLLFKGVRLGRVAAVPADVRRALLDLGCAIYATRRVEQGATLVSNRDADVSATQDMSMVQRWESKFAEVVELKRRKSVVW